MTKLNVLSMAVQNLSDRIFRGVRDGSLSKSEYDKLSREIDQLQAAIAGASSNGIDESEYRALLDSVSWVSQDVFDLRHNDEGSQPDPIDDGVDYTTKREVLKAGITNLRARIEAGETDGSLTWTEARELRERLYALEDRFKTQKADGRIDEVEYSADLQEISQISQFVFNLRHN